MAVLATDLVLVVQMSAGHPHKRENRQDREHLAKLIKSPDFQRLWQRWKEEDVSCDVTDLAGYNVAGTTRYLDRDFYHALRDPQFAQHLGIGPIDTGLSPDDTIECLFEHEGVEKTLLDADNDIDIYQSAHECATIAEHDKVRSKTGLDGQPGNPLKYERGLKAAITFCEKKHLTKVPPDFACAPLLDDLDADDRRALAQMQVMGIPDAFKQSKESVGYTKASGEDQCQVCQHWLEDRGQELSRCALIDGAVQHDRWCERWEKEQGDGDEASGVQGGGSEDREQPEDQESGGSPGGGDAPGEPSGQASKPAAQAGQVAPAAAAPPASPDIAALADSVGKMAAAVSDLAKGLTRK